VIANPKKPGTYVLRMTVDTVDPDTGAEDDRKGDGPLSVVQSVEVDIVPHQVVLDIIDGATLLTAVVLSDADFDAAGIDVATLRFGPKGAPEAHGKLHLQDVNGDGRTDAVLHFSAPSSGLGCADKQAGLTGATVDGRPFVGAGAVALKGCK